MTPWWEGEAKGKAGWNICSCSCDSFMWLHINSGTQAWCPGHYPMQVTKNKSKQGGRQWAAVSLTLSQTPLHTQKLRFILASYRCIRAETYISIRNHLTGKCLHMWFRWKKWSPLSEWISEHLTYAKDFPLTSIKHFEICLCLCPCSAESRDFCLDFFLFPWMPWITVATFVCSTICCHCFLTGTFSCISWDPEFTSLLWQVKL